MSDKTFQEQFNERTSRIVDKILAILTKEPAQIGYTAVLEVIKQMIDSSERNNKEDMEDIAKLVKRKTEVMNGHLKKYQ